MKHSNDSQRLLEFLEKYPNQWHGISLDSRTLKTVCKLIQLKYDIELNRFKQVRLIRD